MNHPVARIERVFLTLLPPVLLSAGCATYVTPGRGADLAVFTDQDIQLILDRKPAATFPVNLAMIRVQEPRYRSATTTGSGGGRYSVVTINDVETQADWDRLTELPDVAQIVKLNRLLVSDRLDSDQQLRQAAAALRADMVLIYTLDTSFFAQDAFRPLTVITLGLSPNKQVKVSTTASAILMDVRSGYIYGACESTARQNTIASAWTSADTVDRSRLKTERQAFDELVRDFERLWRAKSRDPIEMPWRARNGVMHRGIMLAHR